MHPAYTLCQSGSIVKMCTLVHGESDSTLTLVTVSVEASLMFRFLVSYWQW